MNAFQTSGALSELPRTVVSHLNQLQKALDSGSKDTKHLASETLAVLKRGDTKQHVQGRGHRGEQERAHADLAILQMLLSQFCEEIPEGKPCLTDAYCEDNNFCTTETCEDGYCKYKNVTECDFGCESDEECQGEDSCTTDTCVDGVCSRLYCDICECQYDSHCDDSNPCTEDVCSFGMCMAINHCVGDDSGPPLDDDSSPRDDDSQTPPNDDDDNEPKTPSPSFQWVNVGPCRCPGIQTQEERCVAGGCPGLPPMEREVVCTPEEACVCMENSDCNDLDPCTENKCHYGKCTYPVVPDCDCAAVGKFMCTGVGCVLDCAMYCDDKFTDTPQAMCTASDSTTINVPFHSPRLRPISAEYPKGGNTGSSRPFEEAFSEYEPVEMEAFSEAFSEGDSADSLLHLPRENIRDMSPEDQQFALAEEYALEVIHYSHKACSYSGPNFHEFVPDRVYGCPSRAPLGWNEPCGEGYHICKTDVEVQKLGLTRDACHVQSTDSSFWATLENLGPSCDVGSSFPGGGPYFMGCGTSEFDRSGNTDCEVLQFGDTSGKRYPRRFTTTSSQEGVMCCKDDSPKAAKCPRMWCEEISDWVDNCCECRGTHPAASPHFLRNEESCYCYAPEIPNRRSEDVRDDDDYFEWLNPHEDYPEYVFPYYWDGPGGDWIYGDLPDMNPMRQLATWLRDNKEHGTQLANEMFSVMFDEATAGNPMFDGTFNSHGGNVDPDDGLPGLQGPFDRMQYCGFTVFVPTDKGFEKRIPTEYRNYGYMSLMSAQHIVWSGALDQDELAEQSFANNAFYAEEYRFIDGLDLDDDDDSWSNGGIQYRRGDDDSSPAFPGWGPENNVDFDDYDFWHQFSPGPVEPFAPLPLWPGENWFAKPMVGLDYPIGEGSLLDDSYHGYDSPLRSALEKLAYYYFGDFYGHIPTALGSIGFSTQTGEPRILSPEYAFLSVETITQVVDSSTFLANINGIVYNDMDEEPQIDWDVTDFYTCFMVGEWSGDDDTTPPARVCPGWFGPGLNGYRGSLDRPADDDSFGYDYLEWSWWFQWEDWLSKGGGPRKSSAQKPWINYDGVLEGESPVRPKFGAPRILKTIEYGDGLVIHVIDEAMVPPVCPTGILQWMQYAMWTLTPPGPAPRLPGPPDYMASVAYTTRYDYTALGEQIRGFDGVRWGWLANLFPKQCHYPTLPCDDTVQCPTVSTSPEVGQAYCVGRQADYEMPPEPKMFGTVMLDSFWRPWEGTQHWTRWWGPGPVQIPRSDWSMVSGFLDDDGVEHYDDWDDDGMRFSPHDSFYPDDDGLVTHTSKLFYPFQHASYCVLAPLRDFAQD
eukprot:TRINITY_DN34866_c0_g1_i1.p1 TRINITY_DN34866_c0_g1~~TRINITY_DN34866_c0_g1_i1.p1  ORF type:complete len:1393 (-),score=163.96 TRINITY_DN34866_c0_g1_i1:74-4021(-)